MTNCMIHVIAAATVALCVTAAEANSDAGSDLQNRDCIDNCIIEFFRPVGRSVTTAELDDAIDATGLSRGVVFRSLADCATLLESFGIPVTAQDIAVNEHRRYPRLVIADCPPMNERRGGHVVVLSAAATVELFGTAGAR